MEESKEIDTVANPEQKQIALNKAGVSRKAYMQIIADALVATKWGKSDKPNERGQYDMVEKPDMDLRKWGAEMASKLHGDITNGSQTNIAVGVNVSLAEKLDQARERIKDV